MSLGKCATVYLGDCATVYLGDCVTVYLGDCATVYLGDCATVYLGDCATLCLGGCAIVTLGVWAIVTLGVWAIVTLELGYCDSGSWALATFWKYLCINCSFGTSCFLWNGVLIEAKIWSETSLQVNPPKIEKGSSQRDKIH